MILVVLLRFCRIISFVVFSAICYIVVAVHSCLQ